MSNQWLCAFRYAAQKPRLIVRSASHSTTRSLHSSVPSRRPHDDTPRDDDGRKPENGTGETRRNGEEAEAAEENLFGENNAAVANGESSQSRKKPTTGLRSRVQRNRKSDLPPVQIPKSFLGLAIDRHGETKTLFKADSTEQNRDNTGGEKSRSNALFKAAAWSDSAIEEAIAAFKSKDNLSPTIRRLDVLGVSAYWTVLHQIKAQHGDDAYSKILESTPPPKSLDWVAALLDHQGKSEPTLSQVLSTTELLHHILKDGEIPVTKAALFEPCMIDELVTTLRAEFFIQAPENSKIANIRRPATIINVQDCSGFSVAQGILQHVAENLEADILHLRAHDIAHIVGRYIGQDITRTLGDMSKLGYKAAENSGRLKPRPIVEEENDDAETYELPITVMLRDEKARKDTKRQTISMDEFLLNSGTRGKSDELWEDMKVNAALDELIHSSDTDVDEQKPLIVHIHDFNALSMDENGVAIISKIRKVVDHLWLSGRKVVLVGSCSASGAPRSYQTALRGLDISERVIHLSKRYFPDAQVRVKCKSTLALWEKQDYLRENDENIVRMLWSMTESGDSISGLSEGTLGLDKYVGSELEIDTEPFAKYWDGVLSVTEVYRTATTMIGLSSTSAVELFSLDCFEKAVAKMSAADEAREVAAVRSKASMKKDFRGDLFSGARKMDPFAENHEEKLMSGLVNARDLRTTFEDIHAPEETIESIKMLTTLSLVRPEAFSYGVLASDRIPGCLLYGPPGTGKTLLAKAVAKESGANMIEVSGASINNMYVGESEKNVRALFRLAKKKEPMVIFIDEADALLGARGGPQNGARRETINQFLREWDGMDKMKAFIMVATNRPFDLDEAVLRRLPRKLLIDLPLEMDRAAILRIHLKDEVIDETVSIEDIAKRTPLYSGSDLKNMCVAAAMAAVKEELEASERHTGPEPYKWAEKRVLNRRHFDKALKEIGASVSEDMATLTAIRKFDERYGDSKARKKRKGMGFEVVPETPDSEQARVRSGR
ncbi:ATPase [Xylaria flabelliformis]|nr:ATPase [Xylaria flabelliformis]